jgi:spore germination protein YaaH
VPYWRERDGSAEVINNLNKIDIISPFSYEMTETGTFKDPMKLSTGPYSEMIKKAKAEGKIIIPSILWWATGQGREDLDFVLRDDEIRAAVIYDIAEVIKKDNLDGIDIDFENKKAETREPFNKFLSELSTELHKAGKVLTCTIEARTPIDSKFAGLSSEAYQKKVSEIDYANDFKHIGEVCDQVRIMAYDQQGDDRALNNLRQSDVTAYKPVADIDWVEKVLTLAMRDIKDWKKIIVGVPTYGNKYEIVRGIDGKIINYKKIGSMNYFYANEEVKTRGIIPKRDDSGELSYSYIDAIKNKEYYVVYSDAEAIAQKINIAKLYKIGGIAVFKVDGNNDKNIWLKI